MEDIFQMAYSFTEISNGPINEAAFVQIMAWCKTSNKPLSEQMMAWATDILKKKMAQW